MYVYHAFIIMYDTTSLLQVFCICYSESVTKSGHQGRLQKIEQFLHCVQSVAPEMLKKLKVHLLLHLPENILDFGPPANYNTER